MRRLVPVMLVGGALALIAGCQKEAPTAPLPDEPIAPSEADEQSALETESLYVKVLDCGSIQFDDLDMFSTDGDYAGVSDTFTDTCYLIHHPDGIMLWDLGLPGLLTGGPMTAQGMTASLNQTLTTQLEALGMAPSDIDYIAISHSHFDHIGQVDQVGSATWLVHQNELDYMIPPDGSPAKVSAEVIPMLTAFKPLKREVFTGEKDVFGDGTVIIFETPGHTPGHTSLQLTLPQSGTVLLTGDLYHRAESRELKRVPRFNFDEEMTRRSMAAFEDRATSLGAKVIIQHEPEDVSPLGGEIR